MTTQRHLVAVWNPSYASDVMDAHLGVLLRRIRDLRALPADHPRRADHEEKVHVWWGKVRSANRQEPLKHLDQILSLDGEAEDDSRELHLYLTDYRSLYVAHVHEITVDDVLRDEADHVPRYYADQKLLCDCWFRLGDIRRLVVDDTMGVIDELRKLRNTHYHDRPVSLYGGMVDLPLVVTRDDGATFFDPAVRDRLTDGKYWAEFDAERTGLGTIERELRENLFGETAWMALDPAVRGFIASAEHLIRTQRGAPGFDFSGVVLDLAKACEVQANLVLRRALLRAKPNERQANVNGRTVDLAANGQFSLGELAHVMEHEAGVRGALERLLRDGRWFTGSLPPILRDLTRYRNPASHSSATGLEEALDLRNRMVGVGCHGSLVRLAGVQPF